MSPGVLLLESSLEADLKVIKTTKRSQQTPLYPCPSMFSLWWGGRNTTLASGAVNCFWIFNKCT